MPLHVSCGSNAFKVMPCTYTAVVSFSHTVCSQVVVQVSLALCYYQTQNTFTKCRCFQEAAVEDGASKSEQAKEPVKGLPSLAPKGKGNKKADKEGESSSDKQTAAAQ